MVPAWMLIAALTLAGVLAVGWWRDRHRAQTTVDHILDGELARPRIGDTQHRDNR